MNKIQVTNFQINDIVALKMHLSMAQNKCDSLLIQFKCENKPIEIISTSAGVINNDVIKIVGSPDHVEIISQKPIGKNGECLLSFLNSNNDVIYYDTLIFDIKNQMFLEIPKTNFEHTRNVGQSWSQKTNYLQTKALSKWSVNLSIDNDLVVLLRTKSLERCYACLGFESETLNHSDLVFTLDPAVKKFIIPKEILQLKGLITGSLSCFELINYDFHTIKNLYYKRKISNSINAQDFSLENKTNIFTSPTGKSFTIEQLIPHE